MSTPKLLVRLCVGALAALAFVAGALARDGVIVKMTGNAQIQLPGEATFRVLTQAMPVPQGAVIKTGHGTEIFLEVVVGVVTAIRENSTVEVIENTVRQENGREVADATLDLKSGSILTTLNPKMKDVNRYKVRTPLGVAAARGTVFGVSVKASGTSVATMSGIVTLDLGGGRTLSLPLGTAATGAALQSIKDAIAADTTGTLAQDIADAVKIVAENVKSATTAVNSSDAATSTLAAVVSAAAAAIPSQAASFVETAVSAAVSSSAVTGKSAGDTNTAVSAITEAAVRSAPDKTTEIVTGAARTVIETKVAEAGTNSGQQTSAVTNSKSTLDAIAQGATKGAAAAGNTAPSAASIAQSINTSVSSTAGALNIVVPPNSVTVSPPAVTSGSPSTTITPPVQVDVRPISPAGASPP